MSYLLEREREVAKRLALWDGKRKGRYTIGMNILGVLK